MMTNPSRYHVVWWCPADADPASLHAALHARVDQARDLGATDLTLNLADDRGPAFGRVARANARVAGLISATLPDVSAARAFAAWVDPGGRWSAAYAVDEAVPLDYERDWPLGEVSPGAKQVTFLQRKPGLDDDAFLGHWFGTHTPLALRIHPLWRYVRGRVLSSIDAGAPDAPAPPLDGIVELHFRSLEDITDPVRLFGSMKNIRVIQEDVAQFIDMSTICVTVMTEWALG
jgi:uncharacterized protein (TIGR02118 family)